VVQLLHQLVSVRRRDGQDDSILLCILECFLSLLDSLVEYFNKWAFIYVGLYGYPYLEAGQKVMTLFRDRGWFAIVNDNLVSRVLIWMVVVLGCLNGLVGVVLVKIYPSLLSVYGGDHTAWIAFLFGCVIGSMLAAILVSWSSIAWLLSVFVWTTTGLIF